MKKLFIIIALLLLSSPAWATNYFVTQSGAGGTCTSATTLAASMSVATFNGCASGPTGGDTVWFSGTFTTTITPNRSGTSSSAQLTLNFTGNCTGCSAGVVTPPGFVITGGRTFLNIVGGTFSGGTDGVDIVHCNSSGGSNITITNWTYAGAAGGNDNFVNVSSGCNGWTISNNTVKGICTGVQNGTGGPVIGMDIANNDLETQTIDTGCQADVIRLADATNVIIEGDLLVQQAPGQTGCCHNDAIQTFKSGAGGSINPSNWIIRYCKIVRNVSGGSGDNSWMELENFAGQPALKVYGTVFVGGTATPGPGGNGVSIHSGTNSTDTYFFYNNTLFQHNQPAGPLRLGEGDGPGTLFFRNNVGSNDGSLGGNAPQATFSAGAAWNRNFFLNYDQCSSTFTGANGSCSTNPLFTNTTWTVDDFSSQPTSVMRNGGDNSIGSEFSFGIAPGATWPNPALNQRTSTAWDAGAYQFQSSTGCGSTLSWTSAVCEQIPSGNLTSAIVGGVPVANAWTVDVRHGQYAQNETECNLSTGLSQGTVAGITALTITTSAGTPTCGDFNPTTGAPQSPTSTTPLPFYVTGDVQWNNFSFQYGTVVIRQKIPNSNTGLWVGEWLEGLNCQTSNKYTGETQSTAGYSTCPALGSASYNEVDLLETKPPSNGWGNVWYSVGTNILPSVCIMTQSPIDSTSYHTYAMTWTPSNISYTFDGASTGCGPYSVSPNAPMSLIMQIQTCGTNGNADSCGAVGSAGPPINANLPASMNIDFVKVCNSSFTNAQCVAAASTDPNVIFFDDFNAGSNGAVAPSVTTTTASSITSSSASSGGTVTSNGGASVTSEGTCYALTANPTSPCTSDGTGTPFTSSLTGLTPVTLYHYRAFATNVVGTSYGSDLTFITSIPPPHGLTVLGVGY